MEIWRLFGKLVLKLNRKMDHPMVWHEETSRTLELSPCILAQTWKSALSYPVARLNGADPWKSISTTDKGFAKRRCRGLKEAWKGKNEVKCQEGSTVGRAGSVDRWIGKILLGKDVAKDELWGYVKSVKLLIFHRPRLNDVHDWHWMGILHSQHTWSITCVKATKTCRVRLFQQSISWAGHISGGDSFHSENMKEREGHVETTKSQGTRIV